MIYMKVGWIHDYPEHPHLMYYELDNERRERRKIHVFHDGRLEVANESVSSDYTWLSAEKMEAIDEIAKEPGMSPSYIGKQEFENIWKKATS